MISHHASELDLENFGLTVWDIDRSFITGGLHGEQRRRRFAEFWTFCERPYCGRSAYEYAICRAITRKDWIRARIREQFVDTEPLAVEIKKELLQKLIEAEQFEQFLHKKYLGQKRFSLEGCETVIPMLDQLVEGASARGVDEIYMGMAHRGRLKCAV